MGGLSSDEQRHTLDCLQVLRQRFDFLTEGQAWGLLHAFHAFSGNLKPFAATRPAHLGRFLGEVARAHAHQPAFMQTLALAGMGFLHHPGDADLPGRATLQEKLKRGLLKARLRLRAVWPR